MSKKAYKYILNEQDEPVPEYDLLKWSQWKETSYEQCIVGKTALIYQGEEIEVSTVFLGLVHPWKGEERPEPALYETMVFGDEAVIARLSDMSEEDTTSILGSFLGKRDIQKRYATRDEALKGHQQMCAFVQTCLVKMIMVPYE